MTATALPAHVGRFQIVRRLGHGAQSVIYLAFDPQLQREVAVKVFRDDTAAVDALLNEARAVSRLSHPSLIPVFEAAHDAYDGTAYLVFEYVAGPTLAEVLRQRGALEPLTAVKMILPALEAVSYAHMNGVIHRDLKPSNILIDRRGIAKVMDFGIAVRQAESEGQTAGTGEYESSHALIGTPAYMAPEYVKFSRVSVQMDVFSAGLIVYEMLAGRRAVPFDSGLQAFQYVINHDVVLPEVLAYPVDERLRAVLSSALARDPASRFLSMVDLVHALRGWLGQQSMPQLPAEHQQHASIGQMDAMADAMAQGVALGSLLRRMRIKSDLPALPESVSQITHWAASADAGAQAIAGVIMQDAAVTHKLLRMANSGMYRGFGGGSVGTVSAAIELLGPAAVRTAVSALPLLDLGHNPPGSARVLDELVLSHFCGSVARQFAQSRGHQDDDSFICGSVNRLGYLVVSCHFPEEAGEIDRQCQCSERSRDEAVREVLGLSYEALGMGVAKHWGLPDNVIRCMRLPTDARTQSRHADVLAVPTTKAEALRGLGACAAELTSAWMLMRIQDRHEAVDKVHLRYASALDISIDECHQAIQTATSAVTHQLTALQQDIRRSVVAVRLGVGGVLSQAPNGVSDRATTGLHQVAAVYPQTIPMQVVNPRSSAILTQAIQVLAGKLLESYQLRDVVLIALNSIHVASEFRQVIFCLRDSKTPAMVGRIAVGDKVAQGQGLTDYLRLPLDSPADIFARACLQCEDLWIPDMSDVPTEQPLYSWVPSGAGSMLILPLSLKGQPLGMIYADRPGTDDCPVIGNQEMALLATLRNQVALAFRQRTF